MKRCLSLPGEGTCAPKLLSLLEELGRLAWEGGVGFGCLVLKGDRFFYWWKRWAF